MGKIEAHPRLRLREASRAFLASGSLEDLAHVISLSLQSGLTDDEVRVQIPHRLKIMSASGRYEFYSVLAKITAVIQPELDEEAVHPYDRPFVGRYLSEKKRYSAFVPAWEMADLLPKVFEGRDPGAIVGQHIEQLFCRRFLEDPELHVWFEPSRPGFECAMDLSMPALDVLLGDDQVTREEKDVLGFIRQALGAPTEVVPLAQVIFACVQAPRLRQPLFTTLLNILCRSRVSFVGQETFSRSLAHISLMSLFIGTAPKARADRGERNRLQELVERMRKAAIELPPEAEQSNTDKSSQQGNRHPGSGLAALSGIYADALEARLRCAPGDACIMPPQLLARLLDVDGIYDWAADAGLVAPHFQAMRSYRTRRADGAAPWEIEKSYLLMDLCDRSDVPGGAEWASDLALLLGRLWAAGRDSSGEWTFLPLWVGDRSRDSNDAVASRCHEYQQVIAAAIADGLGDLACAMQAVFLVSQSLRYRGHLGPWSVLEPMLRRTVERDGTDTVGKAITYAAEIAEFNGLVLTKARLQHLSRKSIAIDPALAMPVGFAVSRDDVYGKLVRQFGEPRLSKLGNRALGYLIEAHLKYASLRGRIPFGEITEWGDVGNNFRKVFESALRDRLGSLYKDPSYERFRSANQIPGSDRRGRPSLVHFLYLLKQYPNLDQPLRNYIDKSVDYLRDSSLIDELLKLDGEFMSEGSHDNPYPIEKAERLTEQIFGRGILGRFADILI